MTMRIKKVLAIIAAVAMLAGCDGSSMSEASALDSTTEVTITDESPDTNTSTTEAGASADTATAATTAGNAEAHTSSVDYDESTVIRVSLGTTIDASSDAVSIEGTTATITEAGTYELVGTLSDGAIVVDADDAVVQIILNDADITNADGAALAIVNADAATVILADGSSNTLTDGDEYVLAEGEDEPNAALFSKADLTIGGSGSLTVVANYNDGITSKDGLVINSGTITVTAVDDGIRGKDYVVIGGGTIDITAGGDGIKSDNDEDPERGYIAISDGEIQVTAADDGVQAATDVLISGGTLSISAGATGESDDARAIVGDVLVAISGGTIDAEATDDAIHSNSTVIIDDGAVTLAAVDDAIHGDLFVTINGGSILITESYEGIEAEVITINDGFIDLTSHDDGLNVASADATSETTEQPAAAADPEAILPPVVGDGAARPARGEGRGGAAGGGPGGDAGVGEHYIYINGGTILITITGDLAEQGDGIDANGHVEMTGGVVAVSGPTDTRNSAIDYSGGSFVMTGGLFVGTNIDGRNSEGIGVGSTQASLYVTLGSVAEAGTLVHIQSADGENIVTFEPVNQFDVVVFSSPDLASGETYEIYLGGSGSDESTAGLFETYNSGTLAGTATAA